MKSLVKVFLMLVMATSPVLLMPSGSVAYEEGAAGKAVVEGVITFQGAPPPPELYPFHKHGVKKYCSQFDNDGRGNRIVKEVQVNKGKLQDVVVYIQDIKKGKPFTFNGTDVKVNGCRFLVQGGPSTFVGVVVMGAELRILNEDADPIDSQVADGILHVLHAYNVYGLKSRTIFNKPLSLKGQVFKHRVRSLDLKRSNVILLQADGGNYMMAWFYAVESPYYAIVGEDGAYAIDQVSSGKYNLLAWHPILGKQEKKIEVGTDGKVTVNFEFTN